VTEQPKVPVAVMISGRGSNMGALIAAALDENFPARSSR
jgi:phosphoribosylglycinamide formyltransferase-1